MDRVSPGMSWLVYIPHFGLHRHLIDPVSGWLNGWGEGNTVQRGVLVKGRRGRGTRMHLTGQT
jgi:hypothetical protein